MDIVDIISVLGFPIAMCLIEFWYIVKKSDELETIVFNNTQALVSLCAEIKNMKEGR